MLDTPTSANIEDFRQRYRGTYGFLKRPNRPDLLVYIQDTDPYKVTFTDRNQQEFYANLNQEVMFEFLPITRGWFQTALGPRYLMRIPERQFHRGISRGNTNVYACSEDGRLLPATLSIQMLEDIFLAKYKTSWQEWVIGESQFYIPNKYFLLCASGLYMYDQKVAQLISRTKIGLTNKVFKQEVQDFIKRNGLPLEIVYD